MSRTAQTMETIHPFGDRIYSYTRADAIRDGVLIDLSRLDIIRGHWRHPFACTYSVFQLLKLAAKTEGSDLVGLLHDVSFIAKIASQTRGARSDTVIFKAAIGDRNQPLKLHIGPGDTPEPVLTLMLPDED